MSTIQSPQVLGGGHQATSMMDTVYEMGKATINGLKISGQFLFENGAELAKKINKVALPILTKVSDFVQQNQTACIYMALGVGFGAAGMFVASHFFSSQAPNGDNGSSSSNPNATASRNGDPLGSDSETSEQT